MSNEPQIDQEPMDFEAMRRTLRVAAAVGYPIDDALQQIEEAEAAEKARLEAEDEELREQREAEALDQADIAAGNSPGTTRMILEVRRQRNQRRDLRKASPGMVEAFQRYDAYREEEREADQRKRSPMPKDRLEPQLTPEELHRNRQERAQRNRDAYYEARDEKRAEMDEYIEKERSRRRGQ